MEGLEAGSGNAPDGDSGTTPELESEGPLVGDEALEL